MKPQTNFFSNSIGWLYFTLGLLIYFFKAFAPNWVHMNGQEALALLVIGGLFVFELGDDFLRIAIDFVRKRLKLEPKPEQLLTVNSPYTNWIGAFLSAFAIALFACRAFAPGWVHLSLIEISGFAISGAFLIFGMSDQFFTAIFQKIKSILSKK